VIRGKKSGNSYDEMTKQNRWHCIGVGLYLPRVRHFLLFSSTLLLLQTAEVAIRHVYSIFTFVNALGFFSGCI